MKLEHFVCAPKGIVGPKHYATNMGLPIASNM